MSTAHRPLAVLTGGTGFVGRFIIADLISAGWNVRLLVRSEPLHPLIPELNAEIVLGDLSDQGALERLCAGADVVIHAAGLIKAKSRAGFFSVNEGGSTNLALAAAKMAPKARVLVVSSMAARAPELSDYAASKRAGEDAVTKNASGPVTILRPSAVYGRWDKETLPLFQMASKGRVFSPKAPAARICLINVADVSSAVVAMAKAGNSDALYELTDETVDGYTWNEIAQAAGHSVNISPHVVGIPPFILRAAGHISGIGARLIGKTPILTAGKVREMLHGDWSSSQSKQPPSEIWRAQVTLYEGFSDTAKWYETQQWL